MDLVVSIMPNDPGIGLQSLRIANLLITLAFVALACPQTVQADALRFQVSDGGGNPLADAVILLPGTIVAAPDTLAVMDQVAKTFQPHVLVIQRGQRVNFPNSDHIRHHVYSFSPAKPFEIKLYAGVPEQPLQFDTAGIVVLGCNIHDAMVGYIVVADTPLAGKTDAQGLLTLQSAPAKELRIWHPRLGSGTPQLQTLPMPAADASGNIAIRLDVAPATSASTSSTGFGNRFRPHGR